MTAPVRSASTLRVAIDVGGTFTDLVAVDRQTGERTIVKTPSTPRAPEEGVFAALKELFERFTLRPRIVHLAHSTTIATNALLGQMHLELPRVVLVTTQGFRDVIEIGRQNRSEVYNLFVTRSKPLAARNDRVGVRERIDYQGNILVALDAHEANRVVEEVRARGPDAVAIGLLHSYANDAHERLLERAFAAALPDLPVTCSAHVNPEYREYERFSTALVNAALLPIVRGYIERLGAGLRERGIDAPLYVMQSNGGMIDAYSAGLRPAAMLESGPAGGVIGAAHLARAIDEPRVLSFDMGGTTAKAGTIAGGQVQVATEFEAAGATHSGRAIKGSGYPVRFPFVDMAEISAGGGTIAWIDAAAGSAGDASLRVGPISAGADPGPACYGRGDLATVTDANVVLGRLNPRALAGGTFPIDAQRSRAALAALAGPLGLCVEATADAIVRIVDAQMAKVLRIVTIERGLDPREFSMVAFGGNGPLHACALAQELGVRRVIVPHDPGVFSAYGLLVADLRASFVRPILRQTSVIADTEMEALFEPLEMQGLDALSAQGAPKNRIRFLREYDARYRGQSFELPVSYAPAIEQVAQYFHAGHERRYGYAVPGEPVEIVNARLTAVASLDPLGESPVIGDAQAGGVEAQTREVWLHGEIVRAPVYRHEGLPHGMAISGPALIEHYDACTYVAPQWVANIGAATMMLQRSSVV